LSLSSGHERQGILKDKGETKSEKRGGWVVQGEKHGAWFEATIGREHRGGQSLRIVKRRGIHPLVRKGGGEKLTKKSLYAGGWVIRCLTGEGHAGAGSGFCEGSRAVKKEGS